MLRWRRKTLLLLSIICLVAWLGIQAVLLHRFTTHLASAPGSQQQLNHDIDNRLSKYNLTLTSHQARKKSVPDDDRVIAFLHIGKTSGSTLSVNIRRGCHDCCMQADSSAKSNIKIPICICLRASDQLSCHQLDSQ